MMKRIALLGSTGSIGRQAIDVIRRYRSRLSLTGIAARSDSRDLRSQITEFAPAIVSVGDETTRAAVRSWCHSRKLKTEVRCGEEGLVAVAVHPRVDMVVSAVVGSVGLMPLVAAIRARKEIALANKEALVVAGGFIMREARRSGVTILPVDSEHSAIFQCLKNEDHGAVRRIILTASGGPFYRSSRKPSEITVDDALAHPTWIMGRKITVDSATLMNKGLEAIEAHHLFDVPMDRIEIVIHPQSIVHSLVEFADGSVIAQLSKPDMRLPIQYALTWPERLPSAVSRLDLVDAGKLEFGKPDFRRFPCLALALEAARKGGTAPCAMNAANEVAVEGFLQRRVSFDQIPRVIASSMKKIEFCAKPSLGRIRSVDDAARAVAREIVSRLPQNKL